MAASLNFRECHFVTVGTKEFAFHRSVRKGAILSLETKQIHRGKTSVRYFENVLREDEEIFSTEVTQVGVDEPGQKQSFPNGEFFVSLPLPIL
ncbi:hypothetical protein N9X25_07035 [Verrucomicrobiales bacterium]|nr:hypothetical protein [Verrucomicrobiales bacterium]